MLLLGARLVACVLFVVCSLFSEGIFLGMGSSSLSSKGGEILQNRHRVDCTLGEESR